MNEQDTIAVGVDDDGRIWPAHFGMAPWYYVFDSHGELIERRANHHAQTDKHHDDPARIVALLPECTVFIAHRMGDRSRRRLAESLGIQPVLTVETAPHQAAKAYPKEQGD